MADRKSVAAFVRKMMDDPDFGEEVEADPKGAAERFGLTPDDVAHVVKSREMFAQAKAERRPFEKALESFEADELLFAVAPKDELLRFAAFAADAMEHQPSAAMATRVARPLLRMLGREMPEGAYERRLSRVERWSAALAEAIADRRRNDADPALANAEELAQRLLVRARASKS